MLEKNILKKIIGKLDSCGYKELVRIVRGNGCFENPWGNFNLIKNKLLLLETDAKELIMFFYLGIPILREKLEEFLSYEEIHTLINIGLVVDRDEYLNNTKALIPYNDIYLLADFPYFYPTCSEKTTPAYIGIDSFFLASILHKKSGKNILDLCTGTGIQAIMSCNKNCDVTGVDITDDAIRIARLNAIINDVEDSIVFVKSNIFEKIHGKYDVIISNPPTQIIPSSIEYPLIGDGGSDGLKVIEEIIENLDEHLEINGEFYSIVQLLGDDYEPKYIQRLREISKENSWKTKIIIHERMPLIAQAKIMSKCTQNIYGVVADTDEWMKYYEAENVSYLYNVIIKIEKKNFYEFKVERVPFLNKDNILEKRIDISFKDAEIYELSRLNKKISKVEKDFFELCDGNRNIDEIKKVVEKNHYEMNKDEIEVVIERVGRKFLEYGIIYVSQEEKKCILQNGM